MSAWFCVEVGWPFGLYHGRASPPDEAWPPSPLRLFQAQVAGAYSGAAANNADAALRWMEALGQCAAIYGPEVRHLKPVRLSVPNNQADLAVNTKERMNAALAKHRTFKMLQPKFVGDEKLLYTWRIDDAELASAEAARPVLERMTALGHGRDMVIVRAYVSQTRPEPSGRREFPVGASPCPGTLDSLVRRHRAKLRGDATIPATCYRPGEADPQSQIGIFMILSDDLKANGGFGLLATALIATAVRDGFADVVLSEVEAMPGEAPAPKPVFERLIFGKGATPEDTDRRIRFAPLPSNGHRFADGLIRRVMVVVPPSFPMSAGDVWRTLARCPFKVRLPSGQHARFRLTMADGRMPVEQRVRDRAHGKARLFRTVTPIILPGYVPRRERSLVPGSELNADSDAQVQASAAAEKRTHELFERALAHAGVRGVLSVRLQREPWNDRLARADERWCLPPEQDGSISRRAGRTRVHAEIALDGPHEGPLLVGDGRFMGLGRLEACHDDPPGWPEVARFLVSGNRPSVRDTVLVGDAVRRALMSGGNPPPELSGHDGSPTPLTDDPAHRHAFFQPEDADGDGLIDRITVFCRTGFSDAARDRLEALSLVNAGQWQHRATMTVTPLGPISPLVDGLSFGRVWVSRTPYVHPWHFRRRETVEQATSAQVLREWKLRYPGLTPPQVAIIGADGSCALDRKGGSRQRLVGYRLRLEFDEACPGPLALGREAHYGLGQFMPEGESA